MAFGFIAAIIAIATSAGVYYQQKKMEAQAKKQANEAKAVQISGHDSNRGLYTVYGKTLVGSTVVWKKVSDKQARITQAGFTTFSAATGSDLTTNKDWDHNRWLYRAVTLCNGPVESVTNVTVDDESYESPRFTNGADFHFATSVSLGPTAGQNFSALRNAYATDFATWDSNAVGKGVCYAMERMYLSKNYTAFQGEPQTRYLVKGRKVYDPRKDSTSSVYDSSLGVSSQRADTASTWQWSDNPVICLLDYLRNVEYGRGLSISVIDLASIATAADKCDVLVDVPAVLTNDTGENITQYDPVTGITFVTTPAGIFQFYRPDQENTGANANKQKRFRLNIAVDPAKEILENIQEILNVFRGNLSYANGKYIVHMADVQSPVLTLDDDDIIGGLKVANGDRSQRMNRATVKFINQNKQHKTDQISWPSIDSNRDGNLYATYLSQDEDEKLHRTFTVKGCTDFYQAQDTAEFLVRDSRSNLTVTGTFGSRCFGLVPGDVISLTYDSSGFSGKYFRVLQANIDLVSMNVQLQLKEYDSSVYTWNSTRANEPLGLSWQEEVVNAAPTSPTIGTITTNTRTQGDDSARTTLTIAFSGVPEDAQYAEISWAINGTNDYNTQLVFDTENQTSVEVGIDRDGQTYQIRLRYFAANDFGTLMPSAYTTTTHAVAALTGTKLDGIATGATANTGALADLNSVDTAQIDDNAVNIDKLADAIQSTNYNDQAGSEAGWKLTTDGTFIAQSGQFRGGVTATSGTFAGAVNVNAFGKMYGGSMTTFNNGAGFFLGYDTDAYKFSVGNSTSKVLTWDGDNLNVQANVVSFTTGGEPDYDSNSRFPTSMRSSVLDLGSNTAYVFFDNKFDQNLTLFVSYYAGPLTSGSISGETNAKNAVMAQLSMQIQYAPNNSGSPGTWTNFGSAAISQKKYTSGQLNSNYYVKTTDLGGGNYRADLATKSQAAADFTGLGYSEAQYGITDEEYYMTERVTQYAFPKGQYFLRVVVTVTDGTYSPYPASGSPSVSNNRRLSIPNALTYTDSDHGTSAVSVGNDMTYFTSPLDNQTLLDGGSLSLMPPEEDATSNKYAGIFIGGRGETSDASSIQPLGGIWFYQGMDDMGTGAGSLGSPDFSIYMPPAGGNLLFSGNVNFNNNVDVDGTLSINGVTVNAGAVTGPAGSDGQIQYNNGGALGGSSNFTFDDSTNTLAVTNLTVSGVTTSIDTTNLNVKDKNITLNFGSGDTSTNADGAGITIQDGVSSSVDATLLWRTSSDTFDFSHAITVPGIISTGTTENRFSALTIGADSDLYFYESATNEFTIRTGTTGSFKYFTFNDDGSFNVLNGGITLVGDLTVSGGQLFIGTADSSSAHINSYELMTFNIDTDNDDTNRHFKWTTNGNSGSGNQLMLLDESGNATFTGAVSATGSANPTSTAHAAAIVTSGTYGGGFATRDTAESGWYQQTNGADWHFYHNRNVSSDTPQSKKVLSFNSGGAATFANTTQATRLGANVAPNSNYGVNALQNGSMTHAGFFQANGDDIGIEVNATASGGYSSSVLYVRQSSRNTGGNLARFANSDGDKFTLTTAGAATFAGSINSGAITVDGEVSVAPSSGTAKVRLTSLGVGSEVFSVNGQRPGVSNTGFAIRNETDSRNDFMLDGSGNATFSATVSSGQITSTINSGVGIRTTYGGFAQFATDSQIDLVSTSGGTWGSAINFVEGANTSNTNVWSIARKTTGGDGDSSLHFNFGTTNSHENTSRVSFSSSGNATFAGSVTGAGIIGDPYVVAKGADGAMAVFVDSKSSFDGSNTLNAPFVIWREADGSNIAGIRGYVDTGGNKLALGTGFFDQEVTITPNGMSVAGTISSGTHQLNDGQLNVHSSGVSAVIGSIGNTANDINIFSTSSGHNGLRMHVDGILPTDNTGTIIDADADLGHPNYRFKNLWLSGTINSGTITASGGNANNNDDANILTLNASQHARLLVDTSSTSGHRATLALESNGNETTLSTTGSASFLNVDTGDLTLDVAGSIVLDADSTGVVDFKDGGTHFGRIENASSDFKLESRVQDKDIVLVGNDGGVGVEALRLDMSNGGQAIFSKGASFADHVYLGDDDHLVLGGGDDLRIYHDGLNSYIKDAGTGDLYIQGEANVRITDGDGNKMFLGQNDGEVQLYHNGFEKFHTQSTGVNVIGTVTADGLTVDKTGGNIAASFINSDSGNSYIQFQNSTTGTTTYSDGSLVGIDTDESLTIWQLESNHIKFGTAGVERLRIDASGLVDIGSNGSASAGASKQLLSLVNPNGTAGTAARLWMSGTNATTRGAFIEAEAQSTANDHDLIFATSASSATPSERLRISSSGLFATNSSSNLVIGNSASGNIYLGGGNTNTSNIYLQTGSSVALTLDSSNNATFAGAITSGAHLINGSSSAFGGSSVQGFNTDFVVDTGQGYSRHNSYHTGGSNHQFLVNATGSTSNTIALEINKDANASFAGNVTTTGTVTAPTLISGAYGAGGTAGDGFRINSTDIYGQKDSVDKVHLSATNGNAYFAGSVTVLGNTGVGTASPDSKLHVHAASAGSVAALSGTTLTVESNANNYLSLLSPDANLSAIVYGSPSSTNNASINSSYNGGSPYLNFNTGGSQRMRIDNAGNVSLFEDTGTNAKLYWAASAQRLGINTTSPDTSLTVSGFFNATTAGSKPSITGTGFYGGGIGFIDTNVSGIYTDTAGANLRFFTNQSSTDTAASRVVMTLTGSGNLGLGTASPFELVELDKSSGNTFVRFDKAGTFKGLVGITDSAGSGSSDSLAGDNILRSETRVLLDTGGTTRLVVDASGKVAIGTTANLNDQLTVGTSTDAFTAKVSGAVTTIRLGGHDSSIAAGRFDYDRSTGALTYKEGTYDSEGAALFQVTGGGHVITGGTLSISTTSVGNGLGAFLNQGTGANFYEASDGTKTMIAGTDGTQDFVKIGSLSSHPVGLVTGNAEAVRIDTSQNVNFSGRITARDNTYQGGIILSPASGSAYITADRATASTGQVGFGYYTTGGMRWVNYLPNSSDTLTWYSAVAASNVMTLSTSGTLFVNEETRIGQNTGTIFNQTSVSGINASGGGYFQMAAADATVMYVNRIGSSSQGQVVGIYEAGAAVGGISSFGDTIQFGQGNVYLKMSNAVDAITPANGSGTDANGTLNLGATGARFGTFFLGGEVKFVSTSYEDRSLGIDATGFYLYNNSDSRYDIQVDTSGNSTFYGNVTAFSDARLKSDVETLDGSKVLEMRGVSYTRDGKAGSGVIAQELEQVASELVHTADDDMGTKSVAYANLTGYLIEAVKMQAKQIAKLEEAIKELKDGSNEEQ